MRNSRAGYPITCFEETLLLENVNLKRKLSDDEYKRVLPGLQHRLYDLEKACWDNEVSSSSCLRAGTPGQGRSHRDGYAKTRSARIQNPFHSFAAILRAKPPLALALLVEGAERGRDGPFRPELVCACPRPNASRKWCRKHSWRAGLSATSPDFERMLADDGTAI